MQQVKGTVLKSRLTFVETQAGREGVARVLDRLPPDDQRALRMLFTSNWYPVTLCHVLDEAIVTELGRGRREVFEHLGAASADRNLGADGVHAAYVTPGDPHAFLAKAPQVYAMYYEKGRREYKKVGDTSAELTTHDADNVDANDCLTVVGWYRRALELCGARAIRIAESECRAQGGRVCRYEMSWS